jgi:hypothetical protein
LIPVSTGKGRVSSLLPIFGGAKGGVTRTGISKQALKNHKTTAARLKESKLTAN